MTTGVVFDVDGTSRLVQFDRATEYAVISAVVGGYVEAVTLSDNCVMWVNEEGKLRQLPVNFHATGLFERNFGAVDVIVGPAVLTGPADPDGYMTDAPGHYLP